MADSFFLIAAARPKIGPIVLNCTLREVHSKEFYISKSPIEDGSVITDHRISLPRILHLEGIISPYPDNPIDQFRGEAGRNRRNSKEYFRDVWSRLLALSESKEPFDVYTEAEVYKNMVFERLSDTKENKGIVQLSAVLHQIQTAKVRVEQYVAPSMTDTISPVDNLGLQETPAL